MSSESSTPKGSASVPSGGVKAGLVRPEVRLGSDGVIRADDAETSRIACGDSDGRGSAGRTGRAIALVGWTAAADAGLAGGGVR
jgi:hypothetical protein